MSIKLVADLCIASAKSNCVEYMCDALLLENGFILDVVTELSIRASVEFIIALAILTILVGTEQL